VAATADATAVLRLMADDPSGAPRPVSRRLRQILDALERARARYAIVGAVAMGAHGVRRFTEDIDVIVEGEALERVLAQSRRAFREVGREPQQGRPYQVKLRPRRARGAGAVDVDLLVPVDAAEAWALANAVRARVAGRRADIASVEALIVLKLRAFLSDPESREGLKHRADAMALAQTARFDVAALRRFLRASPALREELDRILAAPAPRGRLPR
jgi:hypothetical protein